MTNREFIKSEIDILPEQILEKLIEFISFQKFNLGLHEDDTAYLSSIPGMAEKLIEGKNTPLSECVSLSELWPDV